MLWHASVGLDRGFGFFDDRVPMTSLIAPSMVWPVVSLCIIDQRRVIGLEVNTFMQVHDLVDTEWHLFR